MKKKKIKVVTGDKILDKIISDWKKHQAEFDAAMAEWTKQLNEIEEDFRKKGWIK